MFEIIFVFNVIGNCPVHYFILTMWMWFS